VPVFGWQETGRLLKQRFGDLRCHFVFEYYPWYGTSPYRHWDDAGRRPPDDLAATSMPLLGAYDSRSAHVIERHAKWIAAAGVGAVNLSWWGPGSWCDHATMLVMDVMRAHDIHVTFHLEPYRDDRADVYAADIMYLIRQYGDRRRWDCMLLLENAGGTCGPVFKSFRTVLPSHIEDCHRVTWPVPDYTPDEAWNRQTDAVRNELRHDFDHVTLLADSLDMGRTRAAGFDGVAIYDNFVRPDGWRSHAGACSDHDLIFSFNVNPGFDAILLRDVEPESCYAPLPFEPAATGLEWTNALHREYARGLSEARVVESLQTTLALQVDPALSNARRGFLLTYINSFNEWHEGSQFEPMKNWADLTVEERRWDYHNPSRGDYRLRLLRDLLQRLYGA
jgi:hypothetical protein